MGNNTTDAPTIFQNKSCIMAQMWKRDGELKNAQDKAHGNSSQ